MSALPTTRKLAVAFYTNEKVTAPEKAGVIQWEQMLTILRRRDTRPDKSGMAFSLHRLHDGSTRKNSSVRELSGFIGDFDSGTTLDVLRPKLSGLAWAAYSSHSHDPDNGRFKFRIIVPFTRNVLASEWPEVWAGANSMFDSVADAQCADPARLYYLPSCPTATVHHAFFESSEGEYLDPDKLIEIARGLVPKQKRNLNSTLMGGLDQKRREAPVETPENIALVKLMLAFIPADCDRSQWRDVCWAVLSTGWAVAVDLAREWSMMAGGKYDAVEFDKLVASYNPAGGIGFGTLVHYAKEAGWVDIPVTANDAPQWMQELNAQFAWIEANASIFRIEYGDFIDPSKFKTQHDNQKIAVQSGDSTKPVGRGSAWIRDGARRQHKALVIRPAEGAITKDNCLNEWRGFATSPAPGDIKPFLRLLVRLVPEPKARRFVQAWMAHLVQHPDNKMFVSLAFWSLAQGVGKNLLFETIASIIGPAHAAVIGQSELTSDFNGWSNRRIFIIGDEVSGSDKRSETDKLKGLITGTTNRINEKYQPARETPNLMNFVFLSNHHDALFVNDGDRRFFVWEIQSGQLPQPLAKDYVTWRDSGGLSALHHSLLNLDISDFNPKAPAPMTEAKQQMVDDSRSDLESWVADLMVSNISQMLGRELATASELGRRYEADTEHKTPSTKAIVGACKRQGVYARPNQVRISNGKKVRVLALARMDYWKQQPEASWTAEMTKWLKLA